MSRTGPPVGVLRAFGVDAPPRPLAGGQGAAWAAGHVVLKIEASKCHDWLGTVLGDVTPQDVRIAKPVPTRDGRWRHHGWVATALVEGVEPDHASKPMWRDVIEAGRAFHRAVAHLPRPRCLDDRRDPWAAADGAAWGEAALRPHPALNATFQRLRDAAVAPLGRSQLVHGDLTGNVLFVCELPPAVIDLSLYWRPPEYAEGVVLADALCWHHGSSSLLVEAGVSVPAVARALLFRLFTTSERILRGDIPESALDDEGHRYDMAATTLGL